MNILGYQFPEIREARSFDANWLMIQIKVNQSNGYWQKNDPALLTNEVEELIGWLHELANNSCKVDCLSFTEPNLVFQNMGSHGEYIKMRIHFDLEFRNPMLNNKEDCNMDCILSREVLLSLCFDLEEELQYYPSR